MKFIQVDPDEIDNTTSTHRGRVSYPLLKSFLESGMYLAKLDRTGIQQSYQALFASISGYVKRHELPIKMFSRGGECYFMRLDVDKDGKKIENWKAKMLENFAMETEELTPELVTKQFKTAD